MKVHNTFQRTESFLLFEKHPGSASSLPPPDNVWLSQNFEIVTFDEYRYFPFSICIRLKIMGEYG